MQLIGSAYQRTQLFLSKDVTEAIKQTLMNRGSAVEMNIREVTGGGILTLSTIISPNYDLSFYDYKRIVEVGLDSNSVVVKVDDDDDSEEYDWEVKLDAQV